MMIRKWLRAKRIARLREELRDRENIEFFSAQADSARRKRFDITTYKGDGN